MCWQTQPKLDFISWHHNGTLHPVKRPSAQEITAGDAQIVGYVANTFPRLAGVPMGNNEVRGVRAV